MSCIDEFLESIDYLPPVPRNLVALTELLGQTEVSVEQVVEIIQYDPASTAEVLRLSNSAYLSPAEPASDLHEAITRVGFNEIFQLVTPLSVAPLISCEHKGSGLCVRDLWMHSVIAAVAGKLIAATHEEETSLAFTACILHDLGKILFARGLTNDYDTVLALSQRDQIPLHMAERTVLGFDHAELGGRLLERWKFPPQLIHAACFHHDPAAAPSEYRRVAAYAHLGDMIVMEMGRVQNAISLIQNNPK
ncbi:MAG: HDOD domain-containing protein, partial [Limisphaerales bacterium]